MKEEHVRHVSVSGMCARRMPPGYNCYVGCAQYTKLS